MKHLLPLRASLGASLRASLEATFARHAGALCCILLTGMSGAALAQTSSPADPSPAPAQSSAKDDMPPPGACKPIGLTVSGEVVFPFECKDFIERQKTMNQRPAAVETKPAAAEPKAVTTGEKPTVADDNPTATVEKPAGANDKPPVVKDNPATAEEKAAAEEVKPATAEAKAAVKPSEDVAPDSGQAAMKPLESVPLPRRAERRMPERATDAPGCTHFRTYNRASGTYRDYDGRTRPCR